MDSIAQSWTLRTVKDVPYLFKYVPSEKSCQLLISNMTGIWSETLDENDIVKRAQMLNPNLEVPTDQLLVTLNKFFEPHSTAGELKVEYVENLIGNSRRLILSVTSNLAGLPFEWKFTCVPLRPDSIGELVVKPLLLLADGLYARQVELIRLLHDKDKEIDDYKNQGAKASRKHLETGTFDEHQFNVEMQAKEPQLTISDGVQSVYTDVIKQFQLHEASDALARAANTQAATAEGSEAVTNGNAAATENGAAPLASAAVSQAGSIEAELLRRRDLEKRLHAEEEKSEQKQKKKKIAL